MEEKLQNQSKKFVKTNILKTQITNETAKDVLEYVVSFLQKKKNFKAKLLIFTPNPEIIIYAKKHLKFQHILDQADINLPDGVGFIVAGAFLGTPIRERITGVDFMEALCANCAQKPITVGFLGAQPGIALKASERLVAKYPGLHIAFAQEEWTPGMHADIVFVAFGFPRQEEWIESHVGQDSFRVAMGVGGAFDYFSGEVSRAPGFLRAWGMEWLYRLSRQPWRWKRQLALLEFIFLVLQEKMRGVDRRSK